MPCFLCVTCGTQFAASDQPPECCPICQDPRQYVGWDGQRWTTLEELRRQHRNRIEQEEPGLIGIGTEPKFAIGQRALLVQAKDGNVLWDCISLLDDDTVHEVSRRGGIRAIAVSHPHFFSSMVEWSHAFGGVPIYIHAANRQWVQRPDDAIIFWQGRTHPIGDGLTLIRVGGHFEGSQVLHWGDGAEGRGAMLTADMPQVVLDRRYVTFMYSYPNSIPVSAATVRQVVEALESFAYDRLYGGWFGYVVAADAKEAVRRSAERYVRALGATR